MTDSFSSFQRPSLPGAATRWMPILAVSALLASCDRPMKPIDEIEVARGGVEAAAIGRDGRTAVIGSLQHGASLWRDDGERLFDWQHAQGEAVPLAAAAFSDSGAYAVTADARTLALWQLSDGSNLRYWAAPGEILDVSVSRNAELALLGLADRTAVLFDLRRGGILQTLRHADRVNSVALSADGRRAVTGSDDRSAVLWDTARGEALMSHRHGDAVVLVALSPDASQVFSTSLYDRSVIWQSASGAVVAEVPVQEQFRKRGARFTAARFSEDGQWLLTGRPDGLVSLWSVDSMAEPARWAIPKLSAWKPSGASVVAVGFGPGANEASAIGSNGLWVKLDW